MRPKDNQRWQNYWRDRMKKGQVTRLVVVPAFMEAASLLKGAAELWLGRFGGGRLMAKELQRAAQELHSAKQEWLHCCLGWSGAGTEYDHAGFRLAEHRDHRGFFISTMTDKNMKSAPMAVRLIETALLLIDKSIPLIRLTGREEVRDKQADHFEDLMERITMLPCAAHLHRTVSADALEIIERRAALRVAEGLAASVHGIHAYARGRQRDELQQATEMWDAARMFFAQKSSELFGQFACCDDLTDDDIRKLLTVEDRARAYCFGDQHYSNADSIRRSAEIGAALISLLLLMVGIDPVTWETDDLGPLLTSGTQLLERGMDS